MAPHPSPITADPSPGALRAALHGAYDLLWLVAILVGSPYFLLRGLRDRVFRRMAKERLVLQPVLGPRTRRRVLIHGVSVGEVKGAAPLVRALAEREPELEIVISTTTATGLEVARQLFPGHSIVRFPIDLSGAVERFLESVDPALVVLIELEIWPNFLRCCNRRGVPVAVVNGRITERSFARYHHFRRTLPQFNRISLFCVQLEEYAARFRALGGEPSRVLVTGNMKADGLLRAMTPEKQRKVEELRRLLGAREGQLTVVAGSTHSPEEAWFAAACRESVPQVRVVIVPRHPVRAPEVVKDLAALGIVPQLLTELRRGEIRPDPALPALVDTIGELEAIYALADIVFVGGSLIPHGGQNMLEPAAQGCAVLWGPHVTNFPQEAALLESAGACRRVADPSELARVLRELASDEPGRRRMAEAARAAVVLQQGATALTLDALRARCLGVQSSPAS